MFWISHLHGHHMQIVNFAEDYTSDDPSLNPPINESQPNPMRRDTVLSPAGSAYTFRVIMDNPGVWFFHCTYGQLPSPPRRLLICSIYRPHRVASGVRSRATAH